MPQLDEQAKMDMMKVMGEGKSKTAELILKMETDRRQRGAQGVQAQQKFEDALAGLSLKARQAYMKAKAGSDERAQKVKEAEAKARGEPVQLKNPQNPVDDAQAARQGSAGIAEIVSGGRGVKTQGQAPTMQGQPGQMPTGQGQGPTTTTQTTTRPNLWSGIAHALTGGRITHPSTTVTQTGMSPYQARTLQQAQQKIANKEYRDNVDAYEETVDREADVLGNLWYDEERGLIPSGTTGRRAAELAKEVGPEAAGVILRRARGNKDITSSEESRQLQRTRATNMPGAWKVMQELYRKRDEMLITKDPARKAQLRSSMQADQDYVNVWGRDQGWALSVDKDGNIIMGQGGSARDMLKDSYTNKLHEQVGTLDTVSGIMGAMIETLEAKPELGGLSGWGAKIGTRFKGAFESLDDATGGQATKLMAVLEGSFVHDMASGIMPGDLADHLRSLTGPEVPKLKRAEVLLAYMLARTYRPQRPSRFDFDNFYKLVKTTGFTGAGQIVDGLKWMQGISDEQRRLAGERLTQRGAANIGTIKVPKILEEGGERGAPRTDQPRPKPRVSMTLDQLEDRIRKEEGR